MFSSCGGGAKPGGGGSSSFIQIGSSLEDGTTKVGQGPFRVAFYGAGRTLDDSTLPTLIGRLTMRTWPEDEAVAVNTMVDPTSTIMSAVVWVSSVAPLEDRWHALRFGSVEMGLTSQQTFDNGVWGVRLRPGSHPAARLLMFCGLDNVPGMKFIVRFSEPLTPGGAAEPFSVQRAGTRVDCSVNDFQAEAVHHVCADLTPGPVTVTLVDGGLIGPGGSVVAAQSWTVDIAMLPLVETGCHGYLVPL